MFLRGTALAMVAMLLAAFTLQGSAIMKCSRSGEVFLAGWQKAGCDIAADGCGEVSAEKSGCCEMHGEPDCGFECCLLVGTLPESVLIQSKGFHVPAEPVSNVEPIEFPRDPAETSASFRICETRDPDPPGTPLRVIYASFLI